VEKISVIDLTAAQVIGTGHERVCYLHPQDPTRVIKVLRQGQPSRGQNRIDHYYLARLEARGVPTTHVPRQYGMVKTSLGEGLVLDCIRDRDGSIARTLSDHLEAGSISRTEADVLLAELYQHLLLHGIVMVDVGLGNVACRRVGDLWQAVVIDGLGGRHFDLRLRLRARFPWLARRKLRAQWATKWATSFALLEASTSPRR
jgi:hypothetical protein